MKRSVFVLTLLATGLSTSRASVKGMDVRAVRSVLPPPTNHSISPGLLTTSSLCEAPAESPMTGVRICSRRVA